MPKFTDSQGKSCNIYIIEQENQPLLVLDFLVHSYKTLAIGSGWQEIEFPTNIVIKDKLYLDKKNIDDVLHILNYFIKNSDLEILTNKTQRGFSYLQKKDFFDNVISIQESSSINKKLWFGLEINSSEIQINNNGKLSLFDQYINNDVLLEDRLHLSEKDAKLFKKTIQSVCVNYELNQTIPQTTKKKKQIV